MSRDIDVRVGREVMGLDAYEDRGHQFISMDKEGFCHDLPPYSTDMNAAMEVVEKVHRWFKLTNAHGSWFATFDLGSPNNEPCEADTPALAICLTAMEAVTQK